MRADMEPLVSEIHAQAGVMLLHRNRILRASRDLRKASYHLSRTLRRQRRPRRLQQHLQALRLAASNAA